MFLGLTDGKGDPIHPRVVTRVASETVVWDLIYGDRERPLLFVNRYPITFCVLRSCQSYTGIAFFREADDFLPLTRPIRLAGGVTLATGFAAGDSIVFRPGRLLIQSSVTGGDFIGGGRPNVRTED